MSTVTTASATAATHANERPAFWLPSVGFSLVAAVSTTIVATITHASGISLDVQDAPIPVLAFGQVTLMFAVIGLLIAAGLRRWTRVPQQAWIRTTVVLTVLSFIPDLTADAALATKLTLMSTHVIAAAIIIPGVASRLAPRS